MNITWQVPLSPPSLNKHQVHVWRANLDLPTATIDSLTTCLSRDEIERANKFRFPQHQTRFIAARGILRQLLGNYLQINSCDLKFAYSDRGKPRLADFLTNATNQQLQFNLSHSQNYALYGFTYNSSIGVDVEHLRELPDALKIAQRFFSPREYQLIYNTPPPEQPAVFFTLWTAKEAYLKAVGTGLAGSLDQVEIDVNPSRLLAINGSQETAASWLLYPCVPSINYLGAIATNADISTTRAVYAPLIGKNIVKEWLDILESPIEQATKLKNM